MPHRDSAGPVGGYLQDHSPDLPIIKPRQTPGASREEREGFTELRFAVTFTTPDGVMIIPTPVPAALLPMFAMGIGLLRLGRRRLIPRPPSSSLS